MLRPAAASRPGSSDGRIAFISSLIGLARIQALPPNGSASASAMKLQVTASLRPRWRPRRVGPGVRATARRSRSDGRRRARADDRRRSRPCHSPSMRAISSTMSAEPSMSRRQDGTPTVQDVAFRDGRSRAGARISFCLGLGHRRCRPVRARAPGGRRLSWRAREEIRPGPLVDASPPASSSAICGRERRGRSSRKAGSTPRSNRLRASDVSASFWPVRAIALGIEIGAFDQDVGRGLGYPAILRRP